MKINPIALEYLHRGGNLVHWTLFYHNDKNYNIKSKALFNKMRHDLDYDRVELVSICGGDKQLILDCLNLWQMCNNCTEGNMKHEI